METMPGSYPDNTVTIFEKAGDSVVTQTISIIRITTQMCESSVAAVKSVEASCSRANPDNSWLCT
jgi:hypothetical protein